MSPASLVLGLVSLCVTAPADPPPSETRGEAGVELRREQRGAPGASPARRSRPSRLARYLTRPVPHSARYLDHGVLGVGVAGGFPHRYRVQLALGLLDHLTLGVTAHWLPDQDVPGWSPMAALAFWRGKWIEFGATYHQTLHPPPPLDTKPETPSFIQRTHWVLGAGTLSWHWLSAGVDLGMVRAREIDTSVGSSEDLDQPYVVRHRLGGGLHLRVGTRRLGLTAQALWPRLEAELLFEVRFGLFEKRTRGGWWPATPRETQFRRRSY